MKTSNITGRPSGSLRTSAPTILAGSMGDGLRGAWVCRFALVAWLSGSLANEVAAQGIPEPSLVMYGVVRSSQDPDQLRIVFGNLTWVFERSGGGAPFSVSTTLTNINNQFSYVLRVPCETDVAGIAASTNALRLGFSYTRGTVFYNGTDPAALVEPLQASFSLSATARGQLERVDLQISVSLEDLDGNGLPDAWEILHFGGIGADPSADPDGDGLSNLDEYKAGTDPNDFQSQFRFVRVMPQPQGVLVEWSSVTNRSYSVLRSSSLLTGFEILAGNREATPPVNNYLDTTAIPPGPYFYLLRLQD